MTVVLCGVGGDAGNVSPDPTVDDGRFEYVPIPEKCDTTEARSYGTTPLRHGEGTLADIVDWLKPKDEGVDGDDPEVVRSHPLHRDPNLEHLTYGEHRRRPSPYVQTLAALDPGDVVAFYTGLRPVGGGKKHRYLIGYFTVDSVTLINPDLSAEEKRDLLARHPHNAHAKRFEARGALYYQDPSTDAPIKPVVVDGREPGGLLDRAVKLTDRLERRMFRLAPDVQAALRPLDRDGDPVPEDESVSLGGFKPVVACDVDADEFVAWVERSQ